MSITSRLGLARAPLFLMDGSAYVFRSFYAGQGMTRSDGMPTNVLHMVLRLLLRLLREESPRYFAFILDGRGRHFRHTLYPEYKAHRQATPEALSAQIPPLLEAVRALGLAGMVAEGGEADDYIASLSERFSKDMAVCILGADKDLRQCLSPAVRIWDPAGKEDKLLTLEDFRAAEGFGPELWPDYQALVGDASDNIPGVPGIGPKGANSLLREFKGLGDIFRRLAAVPPKLRAKLEGMEERAALSRSLTLLRRDLCAGSSLEALAVSPPQEDKLLPVLQKYELRSLEREFLSMRRLGIFTAVTTAATPAADPAPSTSAESAASEQGQGSLLQWSSPPPRSDFPALRGPEDLAGARRLVFLPASALGGESGAQAQGARLLLGNGERAFACAPMPPWLPSCLAEADGLELFAPSFKELGELEPSLRSLPTERCFDLGLAAWLLSPEEYDYSFPRLLRRWTPELEAKPWAVPSAGLALALGEALEAGLRARGLYETLRRLEMPLIPVLLDMQEAGLGIDARSFHNFLDESQTELESLTAKIYAAAGREFNIRSVPQLGEVIASLTELPKARKTAGGHISTAQDALEKLRSRHPIIPLVLEYRKLEKLRSTYLAPLPRLADAAGRLHTSFNQTATATGRLSSSGPNLQNIPVRGPMGARLRACFIAAPGKLLVSADYSQIELRVLAHLSQDPTLLDAFRRGEDIHNRTAGLLFDLPPEQVGPEQRRSAKTINFGLIYGMGAQKLAQDLGVGLKEAKAFMERYFARLNGLEAYFAAVEKTAGEKGYVSTMAGRLRFCPDIRSANAQLRSQARRQAINTCIQGSAADIIKTAMLAAAADQELRSLEAGLVLQIHDELLLECPAENARQAGERLAAVMSTAFPGGAPLSVPLTVDCGSGRTWAEAH